MLNIDSPILLGLDKEQFDTDFKKWLVVEEILCSDDDIEEFEKIELVHELVGIDNPKKLIKFLSLGKELNIDEKKADNEITRPYSYVYDWDLIYAAFFEQYKIDLIDTKMHYWKFKALFNGLHDTLFNKVMEYRMVDLSDIEDDDRREFYRQMQETYALPNSRNELTEEEQKNIDIFNSL